MLGEQSAHCILIVEQALSEVGSLRVLQGEFNCSERSGCVRASDRLEICADIAAKKPCI